MHYTPCENQYSLPNPLHKKGCFCSSSVEWISPPSPVMTPHKSNHHIVLVYCFSPKKGPISSYLCLTRYSSTTYHSVKEITPRTFLLFPQFAKRQITKQKSFGVVRLISSCSTVFQLHVMRARARTWGERKNEKYNKSRIKKATSGFLPLSYLLRLWGEFCVVFSV
jgi:hypothetical protein